MVSPGLHEISSMDVYSTKQTIMWNQEYLFNINKIRYAEDFILHYGAFCSWTVKNTLPAKGYSELIAVLEVDVI